MLPGSASPGRGFGLSHDLLLTARAGLLPVFFFSKGFPGLARSGPSGGLPLLPPPFRRCLCTSQSDSPPDHHLLFSLSSSSFSHAPPGQTKPGHSPSGLSLSFLFPRRPVHPPAILSDSKSSELCSLHLLVLFFFSFLPACLLHLPQPQTLGIIASSLL